MHLPRSPRSHHHTDNCRGRGGRSVQTMTGRTQLVSSEYKVGITAALHRYKVDITTVPHRNNVGFFLQDITDTSIMIKFLPGALQKQAKWHQAQQLKSLIRALRRQTQVGPCSLRPPWSAKGVPGQLGVYKEILPQNKQNYQLKYSNSLIFR